MRLLPVLNAYLSSISESSKGKCYQSWCAGSWISAHRDWSLHVALARWNTAPREVLLAILIKLILSFVLFMLLTFCKSSQKLPCCILMQPKSLQGCRISVTEPHHPCTNKLIIWFSDYQIHSSLSHVNLPHFSFLPLCPPLSLFVLFLTASLSPVLGIIYTVSLVPSCTAPSLFLLMFSL